MGEAQEKQPDIVALTGITNGMNASSNHMVGITKPKFTIRTTTTGTPLSWDTEMAQGAEILTIHQPNVVGQQAPRL